ncbi:hypothetical protein B0A50_00875 [Salinomyces thailandicus]|uniref:Uncharacterized protein n=1 Tax=Salinomyces thailandicus TaxID=706561 RepID=A0A4U0UEP2_9PEZI|nr:hypothetical protein B0A50_00875 [Salinomyces thailandica]
MPRTQSYAVLDQDDGTEQQQHRPPTPNNQHATDPATSTPASKPRRFTNRCPTSLSSPLWVLSTLLLLALLIVQHTRPTLPEPNRGTYESGFPTDLPALKPYIRLHSPRFTASAILDLPDGVLTLAEPARDGLGRAFTGKSSAGIDAAWRDLLRARYAAVPREGIEWLNSDEGVPGLTGFGAGVLGEEGLESIAFAGSQAREQGGEPAGPGTKAKNESETFYAGPAFLHHLHCLDTLRLHTAADRRPTNSNNNNNGDSSSSPPNYHPPSSSIPPWGIPMHIDHCIESLRSALLCHADLTPVTLKPVVDARTGRTWAVLGETARKHGCRDGMGLWRAWRGLAGGG